MLILNPTAEKQLVQVLGNWFAFAPGQVKNLRDEFGEFIRGQKQYTGLVEIPESLEDPEFKTSPEGKELLSEHAERGIKAYVDYHRKIIANNQVSMRQDLEKSNIKADPSVYASAGELESMRIVAKYQRSKNDDAQAKVDEVKKLLKEIDKA